MEAVVNEINTMMGKSEKQDIAKEWVGNDG